MIRNPHIPCPRCDGSGWIPDPLKFGPWVRHARQKRGWSIASLARELRVSVSYLSDLERCRREFPPKLRAKIVALFGAIICAVMFAGCGSASPSGESLTDPAYLGAYHKLEDCVGVHRSAPRLAWGDTIPCPQSRQLCCLASIGYESCKSLGIDDPGQCGARGVYWEDSRTVELPRDCDQGAETLLALWRHEAGHRLGLEHGDPRAVKCGA